MQQAYGALHDGQVPHTDRVDDVILGDEAVERLPVSNGVLGID